MTFGRVFAASRARRGAAALCCGALLLLPGCGGGSKGQPIPTATADRLISLIGRADSESAAGTCNGAAAKVREAQAVQIPGNVDAGVRRGVADGLSRLLSLIQTQCQRPQPTQTQTTPTQTQTATTQTQTTPTQTTATQTTPTQTQTQTTSTSTVPTSTTPTTTGTTTGTGGTPPGQGTSTGSQG